MTCSRPYLLFAPALLTLGLTTFSLAPATAHAGEDPCAEISWNVADQRALFASAPQPATAGREPLLQFSAATGPMLRVAITPVE